MPRKATGKLSVKQVQRLQKNGSIYVYEVTTKYNPEKKYNEHVSSRLIGKILKGETEIVPTRPHRNQKKDVTSAFRVNVGITDILD